MSAGRHACCLILLLLLLLLLFLLLLLRVTPFLHCSHPSRQLIRFRVPITRRATAQPAQHSSLVLVEEKTGGFVGALSRLHRQRSYGLGDRRDQDGAGLGRRKTGARLRSIAQTRLAKPHKGGGDSVRTCAGGTRIERANFLSCARDSFARCAWICASPVPLLPLAFTSGDRTWKRWLTCKAPPHTGYTHTNGGGGGARHPA